MRRFRFTDHALDEMDDDGLTPFDVQAVIMSATVVARQSDERFGSWKYVLTGETLNPAMASVVVRIAPDGHMDIITVFRGTLE
ncbi:MAG: DUF4258 domain-containing protein [Caldilineaceae bacterium]